MHVIFKKLYISIYNIKKKITLERAMLLITFVIAISAFWGTCSQSSYYKKTVRPFIYVTAQFKNIKNNEDTLTVYDYQINNCGSIPAKRVQSAAFLLSKEERNAKIENLSGVYSNVFPDQPIYGSLESGKYISIKDIRKKPFLHIGIQYQDINNKKYNYLIILKVDEIPQSKIIWTDFN